jgi:hypothetical protein
MVLFGIVLGNSKENGNIFTHTVAAAKQHWPQK